MCHVKHSDATYTSRAWALPSMCTTVVFVFLARPFFCIFQTRQHERSLGIRKSSTRYIWRFPSCFCRRAVNSKFPPVLGAMYRKLCKLYEATVLSYAQLVSNIIVSPQTLWIIRKQRCYFFSTGEHIVDRGQVSNLQGFVFRKDSCLWRTLLNKGACGSEKSK